MPFERELVGPPRRFGLHERLPLLCRLRSGGDDVDLRQHPDLHARLVVAHEPFGNLYRLPGYVDRLNSVDVVPVRLANVRQRVDDRGAELQIGDVAIELRHEQLLPRLVDRQATQQRL
jgi:hypothetical protein